MSSHEVLGVSQDATLEEIKAAYLVRAQRYHPDAGGDLWAFKKLQEAYEDLLKQHAERRTTAQREAERREKERREAAQREAERREKERREAAQRETERREAARRERERREYSDGKRPHDDLPKVKPRKRDAQWKISLVLRHH